MALIDNFESYNTGDLLGQGDWDDNPAGYSSDSFDVVSTNCHSGNRCVYHTGGSGTNLIYKAFTAVAAGGQVFYVRKDSGDQYYVGFFDATAQVFLIRMDDDDGNIELIKQAGSSATIKSSFSTSTWYKITVEWDASTEGVRGKVDDGAFSSWLTDGNSFTQIDGVRLQTGNAVTGYWDDFGAASTAYTADCTETLNLSDTNAALAKYLQTITETLSMSDAQSGQTDYLQMLTEVLSLTEAVTEKAEFKQTISEILSLTDSLSTGRTMIEIITDTLNLSDSISEKADFKQTLTETLNLTDAITAGMKYSETISEILSLIDSLTYGNIYSVTILESLVLSDYLNTMGRFWNWMAKNTATWTQATKSTAPSWIWQDKREP